MEITGGRGAWVSGQGSGGPGRGFSKSPLGVFPLSYKEKPSQGRQKSQAGSILGSWACLWDQCLWALTCCPSHSNGHLAVRAWPQRHGQATRLCLVGPRLLTLCLTSLMSSPLPLTFASQPESSPEGPRNPPFLLWPRTLSLPLVLRGGALA